eukprot:TRINITY_DN9548_c0_g1_i3.p1 TRINITY_DN9548_c0_g1~~TRINITY_DN9548_c0_g1_i3.p1  ORF type:complete len:508 (+),score=168.64 TRINITY_DN9548_c0_g1_i3:64-1524(+)
METAPSGRDDADRRMLQAAAVAGLSLTGGAVLGEGGSVALAAADFPAAPPVPLGPSCPAAAAEEAVGSGGLLRFRLGLWLGGAVADDVGQHTDSGAEELSVVAVYQGPSLRNGVDPVLHLGPFAVYACAPTDVAAFRAGTARRLAGRRCAVCRDPSGSVDVLVDSAPPLPSCCPRRHALAEGALGRGTAGARLLLPTVSCLLAGMVAFASKHRVSYAVPTMLRRRKGRSLLLPVCRAAAADGPLDSAPGDLVRVPVQDILATRSSVRWTAGPVPWCRADSPVATVMLHCLRQQRNVRNGLDGTADGHAAAEGWQPLDGQSEQPLKEPAKREQQQPASRSDAQQQPQQQQPQQQPQQQQPLQTPGEDEGELREARDGKWYTHADFLCFYGGDEQWDKAAATAKRGTLKLAPLRPAPGSFCELTGRPLPRSSGGTTRTVARPATDALLAAARPRQQAAAKARTVRRRRPVAAATASDADPDAKRRRAA